VGGASHPNMVAAGQDGVLERVWERVICTPGVRAELKRSVNLAIVDTLRD